MTSRTAHLTAYYKSHTHTILTACCKSEAAITEQQEYFTYPRHSRARNTSLPACLQQPTPHGLCIPHHRPPEIQTVSEKSAVMTDSNQIAGRAECAGRGASKVVESRSRALKMLSYNQSVGQVMVKAQTSTWTANAADNEPSVEMV